jgi:hypothetical protein
MEYRYTFDLLNKLMKYLLLIILLQNCTDSIKIKSESDFNNQDQYATSIESKIVAQDLSIEARRITQQWTSLQELQNIINGLVKKDYSAFKEKDNKSINTLLHKVYKHYGILIFEFFQMYSKSINYSNFIIDAMNSATEVAEFTSIPLIK